MGALAPLASWTSEDDQLLKNAMEAGTSLESLGKGAVQFSRRFTCQELKDRWHSLTYYGNVSVEASPHIIECVDSASTLSPKSHIAEYKGEKSVYGKRKNEGVRDCYNVRIKRVKSSVVENGDNPQSTDCMYGEANQDHFESLVSHCESVHQHLPNLETVSASAATATNVTESCSSIVAGQHCGLHKVEEDSYSVAKEANQPNDVSMFKLNDACCCEAETPVKFDQKSITYAENDLSSSMLTQISTWNNSKSISEPTLPEPQVEAKERNAVNTAVFPNNGDANNSEFLGYDVNSDAMDQIPCQNMENLTPSTDEHFAGSSASCLDLRELEEFLFTDIDGKDTANIPGLDSFLLHFTLEENIANVEHFSIPGGGACSGDFVSHGQHTICSSDAPMLPSIPAACPELPTCVSDTQMLPSIPAANTPELHISCAPEAQLSPSVPDANPELPISCVPGTQILHFIPNVDTNLPGLCNGVICCVLNTADTEIPCNDDALFTLSSVAVSSSSRKKRQVRDPKTMNRAEIKEKPYSPCQMIQSQILSDLGINLPFINHGRKFV